MHHSSVAVQPDLTHSPCWVIRSVVFSRSFVSETQTEQEHQSLTVLIHGTCQAGCILGETHLWIPGTGTALCFVLFKNNHSYLTENAWIEVLWDQSGKGCTQKCLCVPVGRAVIPRKGAVSNVLALFITQEWAEREELLPCEIFAGAADKTALIVNGVVK